MPACARACSSSTATAIGSGPPTRSSRRSSAGLRSREELFAAVRRAPAAQAAGRGPADAAPGPGRLGLAALRAGPRDGPAGHRPPADAHRLGGDEPLERERRLRPARLPQEQRAGGLLLGPARAPAPGLQRGLRPPPARRGDQLRRHRARGGAGAVGVRRQRRVGADPARGVGGRRAVRVGADGALPARSGRPDAHARARAARSRSRRSWPATTSSSTASCRTPTRR